MTSLDLSYMEASIVMPPQQSRINITLVGCGGTGSWLAPHLARLTKILKGSGKKISLTFIDHDLIERTNLDRQNFCEAELGINKASALAYRYSTALGIKIEACPKKFNPEMVTPDWSDLSLVIGAVDNAAARRELAKTLHTNSHREMPKTWWLDCGNFRDGGQVTLGTHFLVENLKDAFDIQPWCTALPSPALVHPELMDPLPDEETGLSCEIMAIRDSQSLTVNQTIAAIASDYVLKLLTGQLKRFSTEVGLGAWSARSRFSTPEEIAKVIGKDKSFFAKTPKKGGKQRARVAVSVTA